jgi:peptidoglycan/LPS O-acetylase OafA/YrhL
MPELDNIRGIAILLVFIFHAFEDFAPGDAHVPAWEHWILSCASLGWTGVDLFFALSGFLITGILLDSTDEPRYFYNFYFRRALRILPAYYLLLAILAVLARTSFVHRHASWAFIGLSAVYLSNITPLFGVPRDYPPLWSLAVEEHFYLLWPPAVKAVKARSLAIIALLICAAEPILRALAVARGSLWWGPYTWLSADGLALGSFLAIFVRSARASRVSLMRLAGTGALVAVTALAMSITVPMAVAVSLRATSVNYASLAILCAALWLGTCKYRRFVNINFLSFYGFISYGLYLIHPLIFGLYNDACVRFAPFLAIGHSFAKCFFRLGVVLIIATALAYLSRISYEEFFLRMKRRHPRAKEMLQNSESCQKP